MCVFSSWKMYASIEFIWKFTARRTVVVVFFSFFPSRIEWYSFDSYLSKVKGKSSFYLTFLSQCIYTRGVDRAGDKTLFLIAHESLLFITVFLSQEPKDGGVVVPSIHDHWVYLVNKFPGAVNKWLLSLTLLLTWQMPSTCVYRSKKSSSLVCNDIDLC